MLTICWCIVAISAMALDVILYLCRGSSVETHPAFVLWVPLGLALIAFTMLCILIFIKRARAYSASMLTLGTCLLTCYIAYMMDRIATMTTTFMATSWPIDLPPINSFTRIDDFVQTLQELIGAWLFAVGLLIYTLQCSFACRMGLFPSTVCTVVYVLVCTVGPALSANTYGSPFYCVMLLVITLFITIILTVQSSKMEHQRQVLHETQQRALAYQRAAQKADGVLNHILKNNVVDAKHALSYFLMGICRTSWNKPATSSSEVCGGAGYGRQFCASSKEATRKPCARCLCASFAMIFWLDAQASPSTAPP